MFLIPSKQADNISAILKQEVESCDIYVAFLGNDTHKYVNRNLQRPVRVLDATSLCNAALLFALKESHVPCVFT